MGNFWIVPLLHSVSDVMVSYEYDYVSLHVIKGGAFLESTTKAAARPRNLRELKHCFGSCNITHRCSATFRGRRQSFPVVDIEAGACS